MCSVSRLRSSSVFHSSQPAKSRRRTKKSGVVTNGQTLSFSTVVIEQDRRWLVVKFQRKWIVFHRVDGSQFDTVTFKLNGHAHFSARVNAADIRAATTHAARRVRRPYMLDSYSLSASPARISAARRYNRRRRPSEILGGHTRWYRCTVSGTAARAPKKALATLAFKPCDNKTQYKTKRHSTNAPFLVCLPARSGYSPVQGMRPHFPGTRHSGNSRAPILQKGAGPDAAGPAC